MSRKLFGMIGACIAVVFLARSVSSEDAAAGARGHPAEGRIDSFPGAPEFGVRQVFEGGRFPNVVVAMDGTVLTFWNGVKVRRSEDGGQAWEPEILVGNGFMGGGVTVDETSGNIFAFVESHHVTHIDRTPQPLA